jgi:hypothetical protein
MLIQKLLASLQVDEGKALALVQAMDLLEVVLPQQAAGQPLVIDAPLLFIDEALALQFLEDAVQIVRNRRRGVVSAAAVATQRLARPSQIEPRCIDRRLRARQSFGLVEHSRLVADVQLATKRLEEEVLGFVKGEHAADV